MKNTLLSLALTAALAAPAQAAFVDYAGTVLTTNLTNHDWVLGSHMWGNILSGDAEGNNQQGFSSIPNPLEFEWEFVDMDLTDFEEPGADSAGYEYYTPGASHALDFYYQDVKVGTGQINFFQVDVENSSDADATGFGTGILLTDGGQGQSAFYNEVFELSAGSMLMDFTVDGFDPVSLPDQDPGIFVSTGTLTVVPEPSSYALAFGGLAALCFVGKRFRKKHS